MDVKLAAGTYYTKWKLRNASPLRVVATQKIDIFIRGSYL